MKLKTNIGQIFLTHPKDENFSTIYEETFSKNGENVELFVVLDISGINAGLVKSRKNEYQKLAQILVTAFKKTYISLPAAIDQNTFERALSSVNAATSRILSKNKVNWYGKLDVAVAAVCNQELSISTTGNAKIYLIRKNEFILLSEGLAEKKTHPMKLFSNYSTGQIAGNGRVILSTSQLFNHLSFDRIRKFFEEEDTLAETCKEIIARLADIKTTCFATFIFEFLPPSRTRDALPLEDLTQIPRPKAGQILLRALMLIWKFLSSLFSSLLRRRQTLTKTSKKYLFVAIGLVLILFLINVGYQALKKTDSKKQAQTTTALSLIKQKLDEADATLIYNDENRLFELISETEKLFSQLGSREINQEQKQLLDRLADLKAKIGKEVRIESPTILTKFPNIPTDLFHSSNGFLSFNRNSQSLAFYDFRSGASGAILQNQNTSRLVLGGYVGGLFGFVFLNKDGKFEKLDLENNKLSALEPDNPVFENPSSVNIQALSVLGEGVGVRLYALDTKQNQIWRLRFTEIGINKAEKWLKTESSAVGTALDMSVDGSIYLLFPDRLEKYYSGQKQNFKLSRVIPALKSPVRIFTRQDYKSLYLLEPGNERILIFSKDGKFQRQIICPKFRDLSDIYVDEKNNILYVLSGSELLQVNF